MVRTACGADSTGMIIRPCMGTGWETAVDESRRELRLRFKLLGLPLPVRKRVPFSDVTRVGVMSRESWWSRAGMWPGGDSALVPFGFSSRADMPTRGWRYDIVMTEKGGRTTKVVTLKPSHDAYAMAAELGRRVGLPPASLAPPHS